MPNRIIKESICTSEKIASLTDFEFRLWTGLITQADDAGRGDARPAIIKGHVFPLRDRLTIKDIDVSLQALAAKGCVSLYKVDGKPYFWFPGWARHQRVRDCKPKYPEPPEDDSSPQVAAGCGELPQTAALIQSNPNPNPNTNPNPKDTRVRAEHSRFDEFWEIYPRKVGKGAAQKAWNKLKPDSDLADRIMGAVREQKRSVQWTKDGGQYIPNPTTWLNQQRWEDEATPANAWTGSRASDASRCAGAARKGPPEGEHSFDVDELEKWAFDVTYGGEDDETAGD